MMVIPPSVLLLSVEGGDARALVHDLRVPDPEPCAGLPKHPDHIE